MIIPVPILIPIPIRMKSRKRRCIFCDKIAEKGRVCRECRAYFKALEEGEERLYMSLGYWLSVF